MKEASRAWSRLLFGLALVFAALFALLTPPFQVPDERAHFYRAFRVSEGRFLLDSSPGGRGLWLPRSLTEVLSPQAVELQFHPERKTRLASTIAALSVHLEPDRRELLGEVSAGYSFLLYLPQALGIASARLFSPSVLVLFYAGRLASAAASAFLFGLAVRWAACARPLFFVLSLTPMTMFLAGSLSADAVTNGLAFLIAAAVLDWSRPDRAPLGRRDLLLFCLLSVFLGLSKQAFVLLPAFVFFVPEQRFGSRRRRLVFGAAAVLASVAAMLSWAAVFAWGVFQLRPGVDAFRQAARVLAAPLDFVALAVRSYVRGLPALANQYAGKLGWLDTRLPAAMVVAILLTVVFVAATCGLRGHAFTARQRRVLLAVFFASMTWLTLLLYVLFNPVGSDSIVGMQGRYFIPLGPLFFLLFHNRRWLVDWERGRLALAFWVGAWQAVALAAVALRYYV